MDRALAQIVIDAEDPLLGQVLEQDAVEGPRRHKVAAEGLLDDRLARPRACSLPRPCARPRAQRASAEWRGSAPDGSALAKRLFQLLERLEILIAAIDVAQQLHEPRECRRIDTAVMLKTVASALAQLLETPAALGDADDGDIERAALDHRLQRRKYLLVGEIARGAEEDQRIALIVTHRSALHSPRVSPSVTAEAEAHGRQQLSLKVRVAAGS